MCIMQVSLNKDEIATTITRIKSNEICVCVHNEEKLYSIYISDF